MGKASSSVNIEYAQTGESAEQSRIESQVKPIRRTFSAADRRRILKEADGCKPGSGELGELLRREGLYSSYLTAWRRERARQENANGVTAKRGPKADSFAAERTTYEAKIAKLQAELTTAQTIIDAQKKFSQLLGLMPVSTIKAGSG